MSRKRIVGWTRGRNSRSNSGDPTAERCPHCWCVLDKYHRLDFTGRCSPQQTGVQKVVTEMRYEPGTLTKSERKRRQRAARKGKVGVRGWL